VFRAAFSPDGQRIVTVSWDRTARLWSADTGEPIGEPLIRYDSNMPGGFYGVAFSADGGRILTASADKIVRIWDAATGRLIHSLGGHEDHVVAAAFSPDGSRIVSASLDKTARQWDSDSGYPISCLAGHEGAVWSAVFSPDGRHIVTASDDKTVRLWQVFPRGQRLIDEVKALVPRCLTPSQRERYFLPKAVPSWCINMEKWPYNAQAWKDRLAAERAGRHSEMPKE
jgi:WD40 repeat protein